VLTPRRAVHCCRQHHSRLATIDHARRSVIIGALQCSADRTRLWGGVDRLHENASSNDNCAAVKLICESIRTLLRRKRSANPGYGPFDSMITAAEYRAWAEESLEWAQNAANESSRQAYIRWAEVWLESALRVERLAALQERLSKEPIRRTRLAATSFSRRRARCAPADPLHRSADNSSRLALAAVSGAKRLRLLARQAVPPVPAEESSDRNGALDSRATTATGLILRSAVANSRPWPVSRPRESVQPNPQTRSCAPKPTTGRRSAHKQLSNVYR
jgi:hypothetical protein